ncbi:hypothetical protein MMC25_004766 [Agyrium rufum]|nr:hypothetical protein [Agyrium rufum]
MEAPPHIHRPVPRRDFQMTPLSSTNPSSPPSPTIEADSNIDSSLLSPDDRPSVNRTRSLLNLTSSTLFGIYAPSASDNGGADSVRDGSSTPWGTGAITPNPQSTNSGTSRSSTDERPAAPISPSFPSHTDKKNATTYHVRTRPGSMFRQIRSYSFKTALLFVLGMAYGVLVTQLHDEPRVALAPVQVAPAAGIERDSWQYLGFWGLAGVTLGYLLPIMDGLFSQKRNNSRDTQREAAGTMRRRGTDTSRDSGLGAEWLAVVRSIGAFVGIAFAIRRLPWQSTLQVSLTLALANPVLWYLIDRSKPGFILSTLVGVTGTAILLGVNPEIVPSPATLNTVTNATGSSSNTSSGAGSIGGGTGSNDAERWAGLISNESIGVGTWIASVLFCSSLCFGNIGRKLAMGGKSGSPRGYI